MKTPFSLVTCVLLVVSALASYLAPQATAFDEFQKAWQKKYVGDEKTEVEKKLAKQVMEVKKCNVCHNPNKVEGKVSKKNRNAYGEALHKLLGKNDKKNDEKIAKAFAEVEKVKTDKEKEDSPTFGDLLREGKLPATSKSDKDEDKDKDDDKDEDEKDEEDDKDEDK